METQKFTFQLPSSMSSDYFNNRLLKLERFQAFLNYFQEQGVEFIPERTQVFVFTNPFGDSLPLNSGRESAIAQGQTPSNSAIISVSPSFKKFDSDAEEHVAYSIVTLITCGAVTVIGSEAVVDHDLSCDHPYGIKSLSIIEQSSLSSPLTKSTVGRDDLVDYTSAELAKIMGYPEVNSREWVRGGAAPNTPDTIYIAAASYKAILNDKYASPLYPEAGLASLNEDSGLTQKFALAIRDRYSTALAAASWCTSTSTSCNGCTSSSSSTFTGTQTVSSKK